ncbi:hypothetical protein SEA_SCOOBYDOOBYDOO_196 [Mycobacterium phage ScoobyDoobyDoo]|nr:hypothetical protein SEA_SCOOBYDOOBYDOO_196 [Mycobacterium phage ScoobyDoobyDoo]
MPDNEDRLRAAIEAADAGELYLRPGKTRIGKPRQEAPDVCPACNLDHAGSCDW